MDTLQDCPEWQSSLVELNTLGSNIINDCKSMKFIIEKQLCMFAVVWILTQVVTENADKPTETVFKRRFEKYVLPRGAPSYSTYVSSQLKVLFDLVKLHYIFFIPHFISVLPRLVLCTCQIIWKLPKCVYKWLKTTNG